MKNMNIFESNSFSYEVEINLNMLSAMMLYRVGREVDGADVVTIYHCFLVKRRCGGGWSVVDRARTTAWYKSRS
jgi:hypothetical protein